MAHFALVTPPSAKPFIPTYSRKTVFPAAPRSHKVRACATHSDQVRHVQRRSIALGLLAGVVSVGLCVGGGEAKAAGRRAPPPPPPTDEKKDPNMNGVVAKVLASKKRREAMKESIAKLREKGKPIQAPSP